MPNNQDHRRNRQPQRHCSSSSKNADLAPNNQQYPRTRQSQQDHQHSTSNRITVHPEITNIMGNARSLSNQYNRAHNGKNFFNNLSDKILSSESQDWNEINIGRCVSSLKDFSAETPGVEAVLKALTIKINGSGAKLNGQAIGNALYGLQNMDASSERVKDLLEALTTKINASHATLNAQAIGNGSGSIAILNAQEIGSALYGLQKMDARSEEVKDLLKALTTKINNPDVTLNAQAIGNALYGLQKMDARSEEVKDLLKALTIKINGSGAILNAQAIGNALYGLQKMDARSDEVKDLLIKQLDN